MVLKLTYKVERESAHFILLYTFIASVTFWACVILLLHHYCGCSKKSFGILSFDFAKPSKHNDTRSIKEINTVSGFWYVLDSVSPFVTVYIQLCATLNVLPITLEQHRKTSLVSINSVLMAPLRDRFVCCCQMFCSPQWQQWCCTWRSLGHVPARCLGQCVWCCCWVPYTARLCRLSPAGGPRAVQLPAAPPALLADGGGFLIVRHCTLILIYKHTLTSWHMHKLPHYTTMNMNFKLALFISIKQLIWQRSLISLKLFYSVKPLWYSPKFAHSLLWF